MTVDSDGSHDPDGGPITVAWDLDGNGTFETAGSTAQFGAEDGPEQRTINLQVTDDEGQSTDATTTVDVTNVAPTGTVTIDEFVVEGGSANVTIADPLDPAPADIDRGLTYSYDFENDGFFDLQTSSTTAAVPVALLDDGFSTRSILVRVQDKDGGFTEYTVGTTVWNAAPTATFETPPIAEGSSGSVSFADPSDPSNEDSADLRYFYDFDNDGTFDVADSTSSASTVPGPMLDDGPHTLAVRGRIGDNDGGFTEYLSDLAITNVAPTATFSNDGPVSEGQSQIVRFTAPTDPSDADTAAGMSYSYDFDNDGAFEVTDSASPTVTVPGSFMDGPGGSTVRGRIADKDGGFTDYTTTITVTNVAPTARFGNNGPVNEGGDVAVTFTAPTDPSSADAADLRYSYDFDNDGTFEVSDTSAASRTVPTGFLDGPGGRTVRGRVEDKDGGFTEYVTTVAVRNMAPSVTISGPDRVFLGRPVTLTFAAQDPSAADAAAGFGFVVLWGDGTSDEVAGGGTSLTISHTYGAEGAYGISATVRDKDGATSSAALREVTVVRNELTVTKRGRGAVVSGESPPKINCGADCREVYGTETVVTLNATASRGWRFKGWTGACGGRDRACTLTMDDAKTVGAVFVRKR